MPTVSATATVEAPTAPASNTPQVVDFGYEKNIDSKYDWGRQLGKGGNGVVRVVQHKESGQEYACKAIKKVLEGDYSDKKKAGHVDSIRREVEVLRKLSGSLNIVKLEDVYEDEENVYLIQQWCKGGELWHRIGEAHYSERTVSMGLLHLAAHSPMQPTTGSISSGSCGALRWSAFICSPLAAARACCFVGSSGGGFAFMLYGSSNGC